ncbi:hypothetical protein JCM8097_007406 [Rhodosporidiobolus ruineniae]
MSSLTPLDDLSYAAFLSRCTSLAALVKSASSPSDSYPTKWLKDVLERVPQAVYAAWTGAGGRLATDGGRKEGLNSKEFLTNLDSSSDEDPHPSLPVAAPPLSPFSYSTPSTTSPLHGRVGHQHSHHLFHHVRRGHAKDGTAAFSLEHGDESDEDRQRRESKRFWRGYEAARRWAE